MLDAYRFRAALPTAERLAARLPSDRTALTLLARARGLTGDAAGALDAAQRILVIDPESEEGHYQRAVALADLGRHADSQAALARYEQHRMASETDLLLRNRWRALHPGSPDESEPCHTHQLSPLPATRPQRGAR
jgi:tetratricopeptide (TPR) repeat protein